MLCVTSRIHGLASGNIGHRLSYNPCLRAYERQAVARMHTARRCGLRPHINRRRRAYLLQREWQLRGWRRSVGQLACRAVTCERQFIREIRPTSWLRSTRRILCVSIYVGDW